MKKTLILIDGHALAFRSYFALERTGMKTTSNQPTWAVFGFFKAIFDLLKNEKIKPDSIAVTFDVGRQTFRLEEYPEYKANRETMPDTLRSQLELIIKGLRSFNIPIYTKEGFEADDVIGTICDKAQKSGHKTYILTGDQDAFQLVDKQNLVSVLIPSKGELTEYDWDKVYEKLGVYPNQVADYKGLRGDTSDNIPGIKGIGEKTAAKLLARFHDLETIIEKTNEITEKALHQKLKEGAEIAVLSKYLATIKKDVDINFDFDHTHLEIPDFKSVEEFFKQMQFYSFLRNMDSLLKPFSQNDNALTQFSQKNQPPANLSLTEEDTLQNIQLGLFKAEQQPAQQIQQVQQVKSEIKSEYNLPKISKQTVDTEEKFETLLKKLENQTLIALDTETTSVDTMEADLVGISIAFNPQITVKNGRIKINREHENLVESFYIPVFHKYGEQLEMNIVLERMKPYFESETLAKTLQNAKYEINILKKYDIELNNIVFDTMLASYIKDPARKHGLKTQALEHLDYFMKEIEDLIGKGKSQITMDSVDIESASGYACDDAVATIELTRFWSEQLDDKEKDLLYDVETPLSAVLADMERTGVSIDLDYLNELSDEITKKLEKIESLIYEQAGEVFNVNSPKQVGDILFTKLGIKSKGKNKTKTGFSTNAKILEDLAQEHEIAANLLEQRHLSKLKSTYVEALPKLISPIDQRIHTSYNQTVTLTGRLSSSNPNLQNIPIRTELGNRIRAAFKPQDTQNSLILSADYSQIELRLLAHCSRDENLIEAFCADDDIHTRTAASVFEVPFEEVTKEMRYKAKAVNFGIIYGQTRYGLSKTLGISPLEAQLFIDKYFSTYPDVKKYMEQTVDFAYRHGYVETIYGRKRYMMDQLLSSNHQIKEFAQRAAINQPLQGAAADLVKMAMINLHKQLHSKKIKSKIILQVHDELVIEALKSELDEIKELVKTSMELGQPLLVPLKIDIQAGSSWMEN